MKDLLTNFFKLKAFVIYYVVGSLIGTGMLIFFGWRSLKIFLPNTSLWNVQVVKENFRFMKNYANIMRSLVSSRGIKL